MSPSSTNGPPDDRPSAAQRRLELHLQRSPLALIDWDPQLRVMEWNPAAERMFGYTRDEALGREAFGWLIPDEIRWVDEQAWRASPALVAGVRLSIPSIRRDGRRMDCEWLNTALVDHNGHFLGVTSIVQDVTERSRVDTALRHRVDFEALISDIATGFIQSSDTPMGTSIAHAIERVARLSGAEAAWVMLFDPAGDGFQDAWTWVSGRRDLHLDALRAETPQVLEAWREALRSGAIRVFHDESPASTSPEELQRAQRVGFRSAIELPLAADGHILGVLGFAQISRPRTWPREEVVLLQMVAQIMNTGIRANHARAELIAARDTANQASHLKNTFLAMMSHEVRTPINGIVGMLDLLRQSPLDAEQRRTADVARESSLALLQLIDDILDVSRMEADRLALERTPVSVEDVTCSVLETLAPLASQREVVLSANIAPGLPRKVLGDALRIRQVLFNLVGNALKFSSGLPDRVGEVRIALSAERVGPPRHTRWTLVIEDNGIGMSPEALQKLFLPFSQAEQGTSRKYGGTGLGLSICKRLTDLMEGQIVVDSQPNRGARFTVTLPFEVTPDDTPRTDVPKDLRGVQVLLSGERDTESLCLEAHLRQFGAHAQWQDQVENPRLWAATARANNQKAIWVRTSPQRGRRTQDLSWVDQVPRGVPWVAFRFRNSTAPEIDGGRWVSSRPLLPREGVQAVAAQRDVVRGSASSTSTTASGPPPAGDVRRIPRSLPPESVPLRAGRVLIAEDNEINRDVLRRLLKRIGVVADLAEDGARALAMWRSGAYALVLTDCLMPEMDGFTFARAIRREEAGTGRRTPIVAVTANVLTGDAQKCTDAGMDDFLAKPVEVEQLNRIINKYLGAQASISPDVLPPQVREVVLASAGPAPAPPPLVAVPTGPPVVDLASLIAIVGDDASAQRRLVQRFLDTTPPVIQDIRQSLDAHDAERLRFAAHKVKSSTRAIGARALSDLCAQLEAVARTGKVEDTERHRAELERLVAEVWTYLEAWMGSPREETVEVPRPPLERS